MPQPAQPTQATPYAENVFLTEKGSGFKRLAQWRCHEGPHPLFKELGRLELRYLPGRKTWQLTEQISYTPLPTGQRNEYHKVLSKPQSFTHGKTIAWAVIAMLYAKHLEELETPTPKAPPNVPNS